MLFLQLKDISTVIALTLILMSTSLVAETRHYPAADPKPLEVGDEQFVESYLSLAGLEGVRVNTAYVFGSAKKYKLNGMKRDLSPQIRKRFNAVGLRMLGEDELKSTPGQPTLTIYPAYKGKDIDAINERRNPKLKKVKSDSAPASQCRSSIWVSFQQSSTILRDPGTQYMFSTWGAGEDIESCENRGSWTYDAVLLIVDKYLADYQKAQKERKPMLVSSATDVPESCDQAWLMDLAVFETGSTKINEAAKPILNQLAQTAERCDRYSYLIETHADDQADASHTKILTEARTHAIKDYLLRQKVNYSRLKTKAYSDAKSLTASASDQSKTVNKRVVITPQRN